MLTIKAEALRKQIAAAKAEAAERAAAAEEEKKACEEVAALTRELEELRSGLGGDAMSESPQGTTTEQQKRLGALRAELSAAKDGFL